MTQIGWLSICSPSAYFRCNSCAPEFIDDGKLKMVKIFKTVDTDRLHFRCASCGVIVGNGELPFSRLFNPDYSSTISLGEYDQVASEEEWAIISEIL